MATRLGPRSLTLHTPSLVRVTESTGSGALANSASSRRRLRVDHRGLLDRRTADLLLQARALAALVRAELDRLPAFHRLVQGADDADVGEAFLGRGLGIAVLQQAVGEVQKLGRELIALREAPLAHHVAIERKTVLERLGILVGGIDGELAFGAH